MARVTRTDLLGLMECSVSESDDDDDEEDDELARRAFLLVGFLEGGWLGLFLPSWSLSEKRSVLLRPIEMESVKDYCNMLNFEVSLVSNIKSKNCSFLLGGGKVRYLIIFSCV